VGAATVSRALLAFLVGLLLWATVPALLGWSAHVVLSGSMEPRIAGGDVVLASDASLGEVVPGQVVVFDDPNVPGRVVVHRATAVVDPSGLTTKGDANPTADTLPVDGIGNLLGTGRLRVGLVGLPSLWLHEKRWVPRAAGRRFCSCSGSSAATARPSSPGPRRRRRRRPSPTSSTSPTRSTFPRAPARQRRQWRPSSMHSEPVLDLRGGERSVVCQRRCAG
jgi:signal peptidase